MSSQIVPYDALLLVSFGGPEKMDDVIPFLENVLRGKNVPRERMLEVAHHYEMFDGVSPINQQMRDLLEVLEPAMRKAGIEIPVYWGNRNWHPLLTDVIPQMRNEGVKKTLCLMVSAYSSYSGCRQYRENIQDVCETMSGEEVPVFDKIRVFYNHPLFIEATAERLRDSLEQLDEAGQAECKIAFTAHSLPMSMAKTSDYEKQLLETCRLTADACGLSEDRWELVYQSRSGRPQDPWLEPDILDHLEVLREGGVKQVVINPIGFLSDHMEVLYDLDVEARQWCDENGITMVRTGTVGTHPQFVEMLVELIQERQDPTREKRAIGKFGPNHDVCPLNCCPKPQRPARRPEPQPS